MSRLSSYFIEIWFFDNQNIFHLIAKGLKNAFFHAIFVVENDHQEGQTSGSSWMKIAFFLRKIRFRTHMFIIQQAREAGLRAERPCRLVWSLVGWLVGGCGARAVSRKTPIYFISYDLIIYKYLKFEAMPKKWSLKMRPINKYNRDVVGSNPA